MNILVINRGSSSIKCSVFAFDHLPQNYTPPIWDTHLQWKNSFDDTSQKDQGDALKHMLKAAVTSVGEIAGVGHRIVHGGKYYRHAVLIDDHVKETIRRLADLAPLHNTADLEGIQIVETFFQGKPQIGVFDTSFHHTLPLSATVYPGPYHWYEEDIRRYGFHGTSFQYCARTASTLLNTPRKLVICHLGAGASLCAVKEGKSIDTTMGFTPLEGLMMDTRSGSIDPGILLYFMKKKRSYEELSHELYHSSGLLGISNDSSDMRDIIEKRQHQERRATLAFDIYIHRLRGCLGSMIASLEGIDALVFTAGIGENAPLVREQICSAFSFLGIQLDERKNRASSSEDRILSTEGSPIKVLLIHTREAFEIAREAWKILFT